MQHVQTMKRLLVLSLLFMGSGCSYAAIPDIRKFVPKNSQEVQYEQQLQKRLQKVQYKRAEAYPALAVTDDFHKLEADGWRKCRAGQPHWLSYKDATRQPEVMVHSTWQAMTKGTELIHFVAFIEGPRHELGKQSVQRVSINYANFDNETQLDNELERLDVKCSR